MNIKVAKVKVLKKKRLEILTLSIKKMLTAEEKMFLETTKNQAKKLGMSVNEVIAYRRFQRAFNEIKVYREDHYKCVTELKALKHKMK
jgi:hypothetical protein